MTIQAHDTPRAHHGLVDRAVDWFGDRIAAMDAHRARAANLAALARLDGRTLHDIGIARAEITSVVSNPHDETRIRH